MLRGGGPVPPLGILYLASVIRETQGSEFEAGVMDLGLTSLEEAGKRLREWKPDYVGLGAMSCEAGLMHDFAKLAKDCDSGTKVISGGPHASVAGGDILEDRNIDCVVIGEAERTIVELLEAMEGNGDLSGVRGIAFRKGGGTEATPPRPFIEDLDALPLPAWDLVDIRAYGKLPNWGGILKEDYYAVISTSRGCPYNCYFCHNMFGKKVRARSPRSVVEEMRILRDRYGVREFHVVDDAFNVDVSRAKEICNLIVERVPGAALSFPNGLRADVMTGELIELLRRAGTYRIHYGFETASPRLQKMIGKNLDIPKAVETFGATARAGIITGAYFMLGFPGQTREEILETIDFAAGSRLDAAYFFKATPYPGSGFHDSLGGGAGGPRDTDYDDFHFYSARRSYGDIAEAELNSLILLAQQKFFLKPGRLIGGFFRSPRKGTYMKNMAAVFVALLQSCMFMKLAGKRSGGGR